MNENKPYMKDGILNVIEAQVNLLTGKDNKLAREKLGYYINSWAKAEGMPLEVAYGRLIKGLFTKELPVAVMEGGEKLLPLPEGSTKIKMEDEDNYSNASRPGEEIRLADVLSGKKMMKYLDYSDPKALTVGRILQTAKEQGVTLKPDFLIEVMQGLVEVPAYKCKNEGQSNFLVHYLGEMFKSCYGHDFDWTHCYEGMSDKKFQKVMENKCLYVHFAMNDMAENVANVADPSRLAGLQKGQNRALIQAAKTANVAEQEMARVYS